jgi:hypothetical protein
MPANGEHLPMLHLLHEELHKFLLDKGIKDETKIITLLEQYFQAGYDINAQHIDDTCQGSTLLQVAAYCRCPKVVEWLLHHNADVNLRHLIHVGYNAFSILCTPTITNKLAGSFDSRKAKIQTGVVLSIVQPADNIQIKVIYEILLTIANHAVAVQPACAFSLFTLISLTTLEVMPPVPLVRAVLEMVSISSAHFFIIIDIIDFFVQYQARFSPNESTKLLEDDPQNTKLTTAQLKERENSRTPSSYIAINTSEDRSVPQANFMHLFDILIFHLEKIPYKQQMIENEHYKYRAVYRLLQDADVNHTCYPQGTDPADSSFVVPPQYRIRPLKEVNRGNVRYRNTAGLNEDIALPMEGDDDYQGVGGGNGNGNGNHSSTGEHTSSSDTPLADQTSTLLCNTVLPSGVDITRLASLDQGEDRVRVKSPRNFVLPIFFLLRSAQPHMATILFYVQRHYYGFMQDYVQHKFRQLDFTPKLDRLNLEEFFSFLNQTGDFPHKDVPHDLLEFDRSLEEFQIKFTEREQIQGRDVGKLQMKLSSNAKEDPRVVDSYANYLLFKSVLKYSYPYTPTTLSILELLFSVYDITGNTFLSCCREKRQQKQRDQQLKKSDLKGYHSPSCQYFEYYCELILTFTQYGRYRLKSQFIDELLTTIGPTVKTAGTQALNNMVGNMTKTQHDTVFLQVHALLSKSLTEISVLARRARIAPHIYSNLYIYGQHQTTTIRYVLDELKGEDRYHLQAQDLAHLDYNIMSYIGNLGNRPNLIVPKSQQDQLPPFDKDLIDVIQHALGYFFDFEANFFLTQAESLQAAQDLEQQPNKAQQIIKTYTIDGGDVTHPIINPNGCAWRFTRVKECVNYLSSANYFWHHMVRLAYHLINNNAMNPQMLSIIFTTVLEHGLRYRPRQIRSVILSLIYNIPGYFQGENAPSYPLISHHVIRSVSSGNAVAASVQLKAPAKIETTTHGANFVTRTNTNTTTNSSTRSSKLTDDSSDDEDENEKNNSDYHYTTAAIGTSNAIISAVEQDRLSQVRFLIVNMSDHATIVRNVVALFAFLKSVHVKSEEVLHREAKEMKEIRKLRKQREKDRQLVPEEGEDEDEEDDEDEMADFFHNIEDDDRFYDDESSRSGTTTTTSSRREELTGVVLRKVLPKNGERFFIRFSEIELSFINKFFNIPSSFECIPQFYKIYREFLTLYWKPHEDDEDDVEEMRYKDKTLDYLPIPPALTQLNDPRLTTDKKRGLDPMTLTTPTNIATLTNKSVVPGNSHLPMALHLLYPTQSSRQPLSIKCFEIELASYIVKYRDFNMYDPFRFIKDDSYKIIVNHLQQFETNKYFCYPELIVNLSVMYFLVIARLRWQKGEYKELLNKNSLITPLAPRLNTEVNPNHFSYYDYKAQAAQSYQRISHETPWNQKIELSDIHLRAIEVFKAALVQYIVFYCSDNYHRQQTMTTVLSRIEHHIPDKDKPNKKTKYRHHIHSLYFPIQQPNHPWFLLTNSLLDPYAGFFTITDNVSFTVGAVGNNGAAVSNSGINTGNVPYQHYSRQVRHDYIHVKTYTDFFEATVYDVNSLHTQYFHYTQQTPLQHDKENSLRYKFQFNRDYTWALFEMLNFFHSIQTTSFFAKLRVSKPQMTSFVCKPYSRMYLSRLLTTYKDFVQRDNLSHHIPEAHKYMVHYKHLIEISQNAMGRAAYEKQLEFLQANDPSGFQIGKENRFNFDMYTRFVVEADYGALNSHGTSFSPLNKANLNRVVLSEKINSFNKHKIIDDLKTPPHSNLHGSGKEKIYATVKQAGDGASYVEKPQFTQREQDLIYHYIFQQALSYYSIGEFKHLDQIDLDVAVWFIQNILLQRQQGISMKAHFLNLGHNYAPFSFDLTRILSSHINPFTVQLFNLLFEHNIVEFKSRSLNLPLPADICQRLTQRLPGQISLDELTHLRSQSSSTALYTPQRLPVWNHNTAHVDPPHHNVFNLLISHQFAYKTLPNEPLHQLKLPTHALEHTPLTMYDHKMSNCLLIALSHVDNLSSTQATRTFAAITSYMRQLSPIVQRNTTVASGSAGSVSSTTTTITVSDNKTGGSSGTGNGAATAAATTTTVINAEFFNYTQQQPFLNFLATRQSPLLFDLLELFFQQARHAKYDPNIKHIIFNMLTKQTVVYNQLNVQLLSYLLQKNASLSAEYTNSLANEVDMLLISQHLFWNPAQVHTSLFKQLFDLFFKRTQYRKIASVVHLNQLSRLCVITDVLYHFRLPVYTSKRAQTTLLAFDSQDTYQQQLSLHQFQSREKDHKDSRETLDKSVAVVQQYLQLFNFNAPIVSASTLSIIHDLLSMGRGFCSSCQAQSRYTQRERHRDQLKLQEQYFDEIQQVQSMPSTNPTPQQVQLRRKLNYRGALVDTSEELVAISKNVCSCQPILAAYKYFQGIVEDLIRKERFNFIKDSENHTWTPRVTVAQALYDIVFYYNIYQSNVQNTHARRYIDQLQTDGKPLALTTEHMDWIAGIKDISTGEMHNLPKQPMPNIQGVTSFSFNNKFVNVIHALINHPIDKIRTIFDPSRIYPGQTVHFDVEFDKSPLPVDPTKRFDENNRSNSRKSLTNTRLGEFLHDWYNATSPSDELITQIHSLLTSFGNITLGVLPNNTLYTAYDGTKGFFYYILNNVYQPHVDDIKALLPKDDNGLKHNNDSTRTIFKSFINEFNPDSPIINNAKQTVLANILLRRWNKDVLTYIFNHNGIFGTGLTSPLTKKHFSYTDMFSCGLADYLLSTNTFNYAFHLVRPYVMEYFVPDEELKKKNH